MLPFPCTVKGACLHTNYKTKYKLKCGHFIYVCFIILKHLRWFSVGTGLKQLAKICIQDSVPMSGKTPCITGHPRLTPKLCRSSRRETSIFHHKEAEELCHESSRVTAVDNSTEHRRLNDLALTAHKALFVPMHRNTERAQCAWKAQLKQSSGCFIACTGRFLTSH